jgi:hypothetical protein
VTTRRTLHLARQVLVEPGQALREQAELLQAGCGVAGGEARGAGYGEAMLKGLAASNVGTATSRAVGGAHLLDLGLLLLVAQDGAVELLALLAQVLDACGGGRRET